MGRVRCAGWRPPPPPDARRRRKGSDARTALGILGRYVLVWIVAVLSLLLATVLLPGFRLDTSVPGWWVAMLRLPVIFALLIIVLRPVLLFLTLPLNGFTLGLPTLLFNGLILWLAARAEPAFHAGHYGDVLLGTLIMLAVSTSVVGWLGIDEAYPFYQSLIYRLGRRFGPRPERKPLRGLLILQVDGLSLGSLRRVLERGRMPTMTAMLARGSHRLHAWHCGVPSNTPAVQAGLFYGDRHNVPGYRWFDRTAQRLCVVSQPEDLRRLEAEVAARGDRPLLAGGSCVNTFMSGGAAKRLMTVSALGEAADERREGEHADFNLFFLSPFAYTTAVLGGVWDLLKGLVLAGARRLDRSKPHLRFSFQRVARRAVANSFLRDLSFFWLKQDMVRGVPVIYSNFVGYDDVAHHAGPVSYESQLSLASFDRQLRKLRRRAGRQSPVRYDIVLMSDHGQTPSVPFRVLCGEPLAATVARLVGVARTGEYDPGRVFNPDQSYTAHLLAELEETPSGALGWAAKRSRRTLSRLAEGDAPVGADDAEVVVCESGSLAHVYFTGHERPLHLEEICVLYPGLVESLTRHLGIGLVLAGREFGDAVALCDGGVRNLITGQLGGDHDPLGPFRQPDRWAGELAQLLSYPDSGDLVLHGTWPVEGDNVVVFEEQISSHGGIGGAQSEPFLLAPAGWSVGPMDLESPEALHGLMHRELGRYRPVERRSAPREEAGDGPNR
ncbi:MAG: hypothetical protein GY838_02295 [bacterium]|nr:hypothetical protein [bacterium]